MKIALSLFLFCLFAIFSVTVKNKLRAEKSPLAALALGEPMPAFTLPDQAGHPVVFDPAAPPAKLTLINFWATWCGPCRMEMPGFEKLFAEKKKDGFLILAISEDEKPDALDAYLKKKPVTFPILVDGGGALAEKLGIRAFPTSVLVGGDGRILQVIEGVQPYLEFLVDSHLSGNSGASGSTVVIEVGGNGKPGK